MGLLVDHQIAHLCLGDNPMIHPMSDPVSGNGIISYGLTSAGYDLRLGREIMIFKNTHGDAVDPKRFKDPAYLKRVFDHRFFNGDDENERRVIIPPNGYILGTSFEYIRMPRHLKGRCVGKSTYARACIIANLTPLEPEWEGLLTIEISNPTNCAAVVYVMEGICQLEFEELSALPSISYKDKSGQYQGQTSVTPPRVK